MKQHTSPGRFLVGDFINASVSLLQTNATWAVSHADITCIYAINCLLLMLDDFKWCSLFDKRKIVVPILPDICLFYTVTPGSCLCLTVQTVITVSPQDVHFTLGLEEVRFHCEASSDDNTPVNITWEIDNAPINMGTNPRILINATELIIDLIGLSTNDIETNYTGEYMCIASDGYTIAKAKAKFKYGKLLWNWFPCKILW